MTRVGFGRPHGLKALLPFISYEVYTSDQRDHALAWVRREASSANPLAMQTIDNAGPGIIASEVNGRILRAGASVLRGQLAFAVDHGMLVVVHRYDGFEPTLLADKALLMRWSAGQIGWDTS